MCVIVQSLAFLNRLRCAFVALDLIFFYYLFFFFIVYTIQIDLSGSIKANTFPTLMCRAIKWIVIKNGIWNDYVVSGVCACKCVLQAHSWGFYFPYSLCFKFDFHFISFYVFSSHFILPFLYTFIFTFFLWFIYFRSFFCSIFRMTLNFFHRFA